ncbi:MAG: DMT family transporter, partial [Gammaproteobacteria bacterium]|nr:DMT family transporter [Gammaproteobacteria bacterium]
TFVVIFGALLFGGRITPRVMASLLITYSGIAVIFGHDLNEFGSNVIIGGLFITGSAITFALYLLLCRPLIEEVGSRLFTSIALIAASIGILIHFSITRSPGGVQVTDQALLLILIIAIFCTVIPTFLTTAAVARIGSDRTGIIATVGPAFTSVAAVLVLDELFTHYHLTGIVLTVFGVWILQRK